MASAAVAGRAADPSAGEVDGTETVSGSGLDSRVYTGSEEVDI